MCIGLPMQVQRSGPGHAWVAGFGDERRVDTALVGPCAPGDWLLVFLNDARERLSPERAQEVAQALALLGQALGGHAPLAAHSDPGFVLPSAMSSTQLAALVQAVPE